MINKSRPAAVRAVLVATLLLVLLSLMAVGSATASTRDRHVPSADGFAAASAGIYRTWAHDSVGVTAPSPQWFLAEGATAGDFETWLLVQNPEDAPATIDVKLHTEAGEKQGPSDTIPARTRRSYNLGAYASSTAGTAAAVAAAVAAPLCSDLCRFRH